MSLPCKPILGSVAAMSLAACAASDDRYPSLDIRPAERVTGTFEPVDADPTPAPAPTASADLIGRLAALRSQATEAHADFRSAAPRARGLAAAASGSATGSDAWADAQVALADLDSARSNAAIALGDLDILYVDATVDAQARSEILAAREEVIALIRDEDAILAELRSQVGR